MIILSVLIPTIPERNREFMKLLTELQKQISYMHSTHPDLGLIEVLWDDRPSYLNGGPTIGGKRNELRQRAIGKYQIQLDADDWIAPNYIQILVRMAQEDKDVLSFNCIFKNDYYWSIINMALSNEENEQATPDKIVKRQIWHVCGIKTEIARKGNYDDAKNSAEDWSFIEMIKPHLHTETHSNMILTQYNHSEANSESDKILKAGHQ